MHYPCVTLWELRPGEDGWTVQHVGSVQSLDDYYGTKVRDAVIKQAPRGCQILVVRGDVLGCFVGRGDGAAPQVEGDT